MTENIETPEQFAARIARRHGFKGHDDPDFVRHVTEIIWPVASDAVVEAVKRLTFADVIAAAPQSWSQENATTALEILRHPLTLEGLAEALEEMS